MPRDNNPRRYTLNVIAVDVNVSATAKEDRVVLSFDGSLSQTTKKRITAAIKRGDVDLSERKKVLA